ncbi:hypothetical protein [Ornithinimicrobium sp. INDO-MA30-4]|uniref:hypothetical protein n=1 Tax=Ornithinimicrobium sp. INDO-MA30-4 TaxID=2908651 RepID=UPI001F41290D|nr:hypothetical protein [Ornithinimicrobium sp. INDO-MA30-4]UJH70376.1 hypothetical protein L0A91_14775 [Ornithinimicrobium sp. INDO-MA30-4]
MSAALLAVHPHARWEPVEIKDSFLSGNSYKGGHLIARTPQQRVVEVQIHSTLPISVKEEIHGDYEITRAS